MAPTQSKNAATLGLPSTVTQGAAHSSTTTTTAAPLGQPSTGATPGGSARKARKHARTYDKYGPYVLLLVRTCADMVPVPSIAADGHTTLRNIIVFIVESMMSDAAQLARHRNSLTVRSEEIGTSLLKKASDRELYHELRDAVAAATERYAASQAADKATAAAAAADKKAAGGAGAGDATGRSRSKSASARAGLVMPVRRIYGRMRKALTKGFQISHDAPVRITAIVEAVLRRVLRAAYTEMREARKSKGTAQKGTGRIDESHICKAIAKSEPLSGFLAGLTLLGGGHRLILHMGLVPLQRPKKRRAPTATLGKPSTTAAAAKAPKTTPDSAPGAAAAKLAAATTKKAAAAVLGLPSVAAPKKAPASAAAPKKAATTTTTTTTTTAAATKKTAPKKAAATAATASTAAQNGGAEPAPRGRKRAAVAKA